MLASLAFLTALSASVGPFEECDPVTSVIPVLEECPEVHDIILQKDIRLEPLADHLKSYFTKVNRAPTRIGIDAGVPISATHIYVTSTNGQRSGLCTDARNPCAVDYVFGITGFIIEDFTAIHFDPNPPVAYPKIMICITKYVWLLGEGTTLKDSLQIRFQYDDRVLPANVLRTISVQNFCFYDYYVPCIHVAINKLSSGIDSQFVFDVRACNFSEDHCRCIEIHIDNSSTDCCLDGICFYNVININIVDCNFLTCDRAADAIDPVGGFVLIDNRNGIIPVAPCFINCNFCDNCFYTLSGSVGTLVGGCIAAINCYAFCICDSYFYNNKLVGCYADVYGGCVYVYNDPSCSPLRYSLVATTVFEKNLIDGVNPAGITGAGVAMFYNGHEVAFSLNNKFICNIIRNVEVAAGVDIANVDGLHFIVCGNKFLQQIVDGNAATNTALIPSYIVGGSIFYEARIEATRGIDIVEFGIQNSLFVGPSGFFFVASNPSNQLLNKFIAGGAVAIINGNTDDFLNVNVTGTNFVNNHATVGGAIIVLAPGYTPRLPCDALLGHIRTRVHIKRVYFEGCVALRYGGSLVVSPPQCSSPRGLYGEETKIFDVEIINVTNHLNWHPSSSFTLSTARIGVCKLLAYKNEAGLGLINAIQSSLALKGFVNISETTTVRISNVLPAIGGIFIMGAKSSLTFLPDTHVFINASGSTVSQYGWGIQLDPSAQFIPVVNYTNAGYIIVNRVDPSNNVYLIAMTISRDVVPNTCSERGFVACSSVDPLVKCINYCSCFGGSGDPYCGVCALTPTPMPPTLPPTEVPTATSTPTPIFTDTTPPRTATEIITPTPMPPTAVPTATEVVPPTRSPTMVPSTYCPPTPTELCTPTKVPGYSLSISLSFKLDRTYKSVKDPCVYADSEEAYILVETSMTGGVLKFLRLSITDVDRTTGASISFNIVIPNDNLTITYWNDKPNCFGLSLKMFTWPASSTSRSLTLKVEVEYILPSTMDSGEPLALPGDGSLIFQHAEPNNSNGAQNQNAPGAGFNLFGLHKLLLLAAVLAAPTAVALL